MERERPNVGVGVIVVKDGTILLGYRIAKHGAGSWQLPGGHLEWGDTFEDTVRREVREETGLTDIEIEGLVSVYNERDYGKHYVCLGFLARLVSGEPYPAEPDKSSEWLWADPDNLPEPLFIPSKRTIDNWKAGTIYSD